MSELQLRDVGEIAPDAIQGRPGIRLLFDEEMLFVDALDAGEQLLEVDDAGAELRVVPRAELRNVLDVKRPIARPELSHVLHGVMTGHRRVARVELQPYVGRIGSRGKNIIGDLA